MTRELCTMNISPVEFAEAVVNAQDKLERLIRLYGDAGGNRTDPSYIMQLVVEEIQVQRLSAEMMFTFN